MLIALALVCQAFAAEPLTWLEAAIFFLFALSVYPTQVHPCANSANCGVYAL